MICVAFDGVPQTVGRRREKVEGGTADETDVPKDRCWTWKNNAALMYQVGIEIVLVGDV